MTNLIKVAAVQPDTEIGNTQRNIEHNAEFAVQAVDAGAKWIALPEFFNTGVAWKPELADRIETIDGPSVNFLRDFSKQYEVTIGGSIMLRTSSGSVRNRYFCFSEGRLVGTHDKDYPTMWENAFYEGGEASDEGYLGKVGDIRVGTAMCWEFLRCGTARRLRGKIDLLLGGTHWWSIPSNWPEFLQKRYEPDNEANVLQCAVRTAQLIGAPVVNASHCNKFSCEMPGLPFKYRGQNEGNTAIIDASGKVLALRSKQEGAGFVIAELNPNAIPTNIPIPKRFWLRRRGPIPTFAWHQQRILGRAWYKKNILAK